MQTDDSARERRPFRIRSARDFGAAIKYFRIVDGLTQAQLASRAGVHRSYLSELEGGHTTEAMGYLMDLFRELGVRVSIVPDDR